jgi:hypothetical protein
MAALGGTSPRLAVFAVQVVPRLECCLLVVVGALAVAVIRACPMLGRL